MLSVIIPAHNEQGCIEQTVVHLSEVLNREQISHEILVIDDHSSDQTLTILKNLSSKISTLRYVSNLSTGGYGNAVRFGLDTYKGDAAAIVMADSSDDPEDLVRYYRTFEQGYDCVFGSRFIRGGRVMDYPRLKLVINRFANGLVRVIFGVKYNDFTNAFKLYSRQTLEGLKPYLAHHFNLTLELPLKAIVRGYNFAVVPNSWTQRKVGASKLKIKEMGSRYFFILMYCLIEKFFSRGDYKKKQ